MGRKFKHKKTGEIISYKDGVIKSGSFIFELGCEPSKEYWEEVVEKPVLFTTEDGVSIKEGDNYWFIWVKGKYLPNYQTFYHPYFVENVAKLDSDEYWSENARFFSTKKAAENYIICNKPCLSFNDVWNIGDSKSSDNDCIVISKKQLKELVKAKIDL